PHLHEFLVPEVMAESEWTGLAAEARAGVERAVEGALARPPPDPGSLTQHVFFENPDGTRALQEQGGLAPEGHVTAPASRTARPSGPRINMLTAIRRTLDVELAANPALGGFGEAVGPTGGVHGATLGLQDKYGAERVFDTSLSEEGIIGRAVGLALAGLLPVAEIQFRKYADSAAEQLNDCGTLRWRTHNRFAAPMVVRMPGGFFKCGDPWHSQTNEVAWVHGVGWQVAVHASVEKTHRGLIVHEDNLTAGFGAEIAASLVQESFFSLEAPIERLAMPDIPSPHSPVLLDAALPDVGRITQSIQRLASL